MLSAAAVAFTVLLLSACNDGLSPNLRGAAVQIYLGAAVFDEQTVAVDSIIPLTAKVIDATGDPVAGEEVEWSSDRPDIAAVDQTGVVVAKALGTAIITARHEVGETTGRINVAALVTGPIECTASEELAIARGEVRILSGDEAVGLCLPGVAGGAEYTLVAVNTGKASASILPVNMRATGVSAVSGPPNPSLAPTTTTTFQRDYAWEFHQRLREDVSRNLEPKLRSGISTALVPGTISRQMAPGDLLSFNASTVGADGCADTNPRHGRIRRITTRAIIVADTLNPAGGFTDADYQAFGTFFDEQVWPLITTSFGLPSDIDNNDKTIIFFTVAVNELPDNDNRPEHSGSYIGGFFFNRDLFPRSSCEGSNVAEMFYMLVPDPNGQPQLGGRRAFSLNFVKERAPTLIVHEFQHLVNDSRRLHINKALIWEETWLNEGLSHIAEELMFFHRAAGLDARQNIGPASFTTAEQKTLFNSFQVDNHDRFTSYIEEIHNESLYGPDLLSTRGAAWAFLRYTADRFSAGEAALWKALVTDTKKSGFANLEQALAQNPSDWVTDWGIALYLDDTGLTTDPRFMTTSWNLRAMYTSAQLLFPLRFNEPYPLTAPRLFNSQNRRLALEGGGIGYARVGVLSGARAAVRVTVGALPDGNQLPPPSRLKIAVVRTK